MCVFFGGGGDDENSKKSALESVVHKKKIFSTSSLYFQLHRICSTRGSCLHRIFSTRVSLHGIFSNRVSCLHRIFSTRSVYIISRYGVATVSRIDKMIGLFCKRDL